MDERPPGFTAALRTRAFGVLYAAELQSLVGNQFARVALSFLVFRRTGSASATALTYAATFLPAIAGGIALAGIGDRLPRRAVMICCDLARAGLFAAMAIPGLPIPPMILLLVVAVFVGPAFTASEVSYLAAVLPAEIFRVGNGLRLMGNQAAQIAGFALGGVLVATAGARGVLLINAGTFVFSAALIALSLAGRSSARAAKPAADADAAPRRGQLRRAVLGDRRVFVLLALSSLAGLFVVPEGLAIPFGADTGATTAESGLLLASIPLGSTLGVLLMVRFVPKPRRTLVAGWMAVGCGLPLVVTGFVPHWPAAVACWCVCGALAAYQVEVLTSVVQLIDDQLRARLVGLANAVLLGAQGIGLAVFGEIAKRTTPAHAIGVAGALGSVLALGIVARNARLLALGRAPMPPRHRRATHEDAPASSRTHMSSPAANTTRTG